MTQFLVKTAFVCLAVISLVGCQTTREILDLETNAEVDFEISTFVNPDQDNRTSPVNVTVIQLRDKRQFEQEDFIALYQDTASRLAGDYITQTTLKEFLPGELRLELFELSTEVKYLGILVAFSNYKNAKTRIVLPIEPHQTNEYLVNIEGLNVRAQED